MTTVFFDVNKLPANIGIRKQPSQHCHGPVLAVLGRENFIELCHARIVNDPSHPVRRVYDEVMIECQNPPPQGWGMPPGAVPTFDSVSTRLEHSRARLWPVVPNTVHQVNIQGPWCTTWQGRLHLVDYDNKWGVALFASDLAIRALRRSSTLYIDATFCTAPHPYEQILTIHGMYRNHHIHLASAFMDGRIAGQYAYIPRLLKSWARLLNGRRLRPATVVMDFEAGLIGAVRQQFPNCPIGNCCKGDAISIFCQSLWHRVQALGMATLYHQNRGVQCNYASGRLWPSAFCQHDTWDSSSGKSNFKGIEHDYMWS